MCRSGPAAREFGGPPFKVLVDSLKTRGIDSRPATSSNGLKPGMTFHGEILT